jgi:hypothetical protein
MLSLEAMMLRYLIFQKSYKIRCSVRRLRLTVLTCLPRGSDRRANQRVCTTDIRRAVAAEYHPKDLVD